MKLECVTVHVVTADSITPNAVAECLHEEELDRAGQFKLARHGFLWSVYRASLRIILGQHLGLEARQVPITLTAQGKPMLAAPFDSIHFNLSHCDDLGLVAVSRSGPIGIDLEHSRRAEDLLECEATFCHPEEIDVLPDNAGARACRLLEIWTAKEAFLKALGTGLFTPPEQIILRFDQGEITALSPQGLTHRVIRLCSPLFPNHLAHLCALQPIGDVEMLNVLKIPITDREFSPNRPWPT